MLAYPPSAEDLKEGPEDNFYWSILEVIMGLRIGAEWLVSAPRPTPAPHARTSAVCDWRTRRIIET